MLNSRILLTLASVSTVAWAGMVPGLGDAGQFGHNFRKRDNATLFHGPYNTQGRDIVDSRGEKVTWAGVNWPMSGW